VSRPSLRPPQPAKPTPPTREEARPAPSTANEPDAERSRVEIVLDTLRAEHRRETEACQAALTALRTTQPEQ
jgi:hypothetical protein